MSSGEAQYFAFRKGTRTEGGTLIAVKGAPPFPDLGVAMQATTGTYPRDVKTVITVRRAARGR